jgi:hypothetical protein
MTTDEVFTPMRKNNKIQALENINTRAPAEPTRYPVAELVRFVTGRRYGRFVSRELNILV